MRLQSHQAPVPVDDTIELSEQEFEERSNKNVERWVSIHVIPVGGLLLSSTENSSHSALYLGISYLASFAHVSDSVRWKDSHFQGD